METYVNQNREEDILKQFVELLKQQNMGEQSQDFTELFQYIVSMQIQLNVMTNELQGVREQLSQLQANQPQTVKERIGEKTESFQENILDLSERASEAKGHLIDTAKDAVKTFLGKGKAAMCKAIQKGISHVRKLLAGCREKMAFMMADCQNTLHQVDGIGAELKQIGNSVSNVGRLFSGKDAKEVQGEKLGVGITRAFGKLMKNMMAGLQKNINSIGKAMEKLDQLSDHLGERASVKDKLSKMQVKAKTETGQQKEAPEHVKSNEVCI